MKRMNRFVAVGAFALAATFYGQALAVNDAPLNDNWAPSEWGADDKAGSVNRTRPEMVLKAVRLVKQVARKGLLTDFLSGCQLEAREFATLFEDEGIEGMKAFLEKRSPNWQD